MARGGWTAALLAAGSLALTAGALWLVLRAAPDVALPATSPAGAPALGESRAFRETADGEGPATEIRPEHAGPGARTNRPPIDAIPMEGQVRDEHGRPLEGAIVLLDGQRATTDARGRFRVEAVTQGEHDLLVAKDGHHLHQRKVTLPGSSLDTRLALLRGLRGVVRDPDGKALPGFTVRAHRKGPQGGESVTDDEGRYDVRGLRGGTYSLYVAPGWHDGVPYLPLWKDRVRASTRGTTDLTLQRGATISGSVFGPEGQPVEEARISAKTRGKDFARAYFFAQSAQDGTFAVIVPPEEFYFLTVTTPTGGEAGFRFLEWRDDEHRAAGARDVRVELEPGAAIEGRLVDQRGRGVGGQSLEIVQTIRNQIYPKRSARARTRADGSFRFGGLDPFDYVIRLPHDDAASKTHVLTRGTRVTAGTLDAEAAWVAGVPLRGRLVTPEGEPLAKRLLQFHGVDTESWVGARGTYTEEDGSFALPLVAPGTYRVRVKVSSKGFGTYHSFPDQRTGHGDLELLWEPREVDR